MNIVLNTKQIKELLLELTQNKSDFWKIHISEYPDGKDIIVSFCTVHAGKEFFGNVSEALNILSDVLENYKIGYRDIEPQIIVPLTSCHTHFEVTFGWTEPLK